MKTFLIQVLYQEPCPGCGIFIEKIGGCNTMQCSKCKTAFCWWCLSPYNIEFNHKMELACPYRNLATSGCFQILCVLLLARIGKIFPEVGKFYSYFFNLNIQIFACFIFLIIGFFAIINLSTVLWYLCVGIFQQKTLY